MLVNVKKLPAGIAVPAQGLAVIGAAATLTDLADHAALAKAYPALTDAARGVGTPQIRNVGTVGGNLMQRPRCWYFRNEEFNCLKKGGARCFAVEGENQYHAIFGDGPCHIVHPSSLAMPLIAYGARIKVAGPQGEREIEADKFFLMPDRNMFGETVLEPTELVTEVVIPTSRNVSAATYEVKFKQSHDWPIVTASVALRMSGGVVESARVVLGAVAPIPWRSLPAEQLLKGKRIDEAVAWQAAEAALADAKPMSGNGYKVQVAKTALRRAIMKATGAKCRDVERSMDHPKPTSPLVSHANCEHLRHKGMYVMSVVDPAEFQFYDKYDATAYWCMKTQKPLGPGRQGRARLGLPRRAGVLFALRREECHIPRRREGAKARTVESLARDELPRPALCDNCFRALKALRDLRAFAPSRL